MEDALKLRVVYEDTSLLIVDKQEQLPTVPLKDDKPDKPTLLSLAGERYPEVLQVFGQNTWEGGVLHRLDTATSGLVVIARTSEAFATLQAMQKADLFFKEYVAISSERQQALEAGFPAYPYEDPFSCGGKEVIVGSLFRRYGENRREVRPVLPDSPRHLLQKATGTWYTTCICYSGETETGAKKFICRLSSGFRHQVRTHMAWCGWPLDGDMVYQGKVQDHLGLRSVAVSFQHPVTNEPLEVRVDN